MGRSEPDGTSLRLHQVAVVGPVLGVSDDETGQLVALAMAKPEAGWTPGDGK